MIKRIFACLFITVIFICSGYKKPDKYVIQAEKDAFYHNNVGLNYLKDRIYYAAIQEFKIAISLSPSTQASAIFYNNLGETYIFIGYPEQARPCFEDAIKLYGLNLQYHKNLIKCYKLLGITESKLKELQTATDPLSRIQLGMLYIEMGKTRKGINTLDEFCMEEPDLLITPAVRQYMKEIIDKSK